MSGVSPSFVFPAPGPSLPSWPVFTAEPSPGETPFDRMRVYIEQALSDRNNYPADGFGTPAASIRIHDIIEPLFVGSSQDSDDAWTNSIHAVQLYCLVCPPTENGEQRGETDELGWPFCGGDNINTQSASVEKIGWIPLSDDVNRGLQVPKPSSGWESTSLVCTIAMYMILDITDTTGPLHWNRPSIMSQLFMVSSTPRDGAWDSNVLMSYRYSAAYPLGIQNGTVQEYGEELYSTSVYTPSPTSTQDWWDVYVTGSGYTPPARYPVESCVVSRFNACRTGEWYEWSIGKRVGVVFGAIAGFIIVLLLLRLYCQNRRSHTREKKRPILLSDLRAQQAAEEGASAERRFVDGLYGVQTSTSEGVRHNSGRASEGDSTGEGPHLAGRNHVGHNYQEASLEDMPPAYHEAVKDDRRTGPEIAPQVNESPFGGRPPTYSDVAQPAPVASTRTRIPYPTLPQSPRR
jgi:hypothetical protein